MFCFDSIFTILGISNENEFERCYFDVPKLVTVRGILAIRRPMLWAQIDPVVGAPLTPNKQTRPLLERPWRLDKSW